MENDDFILNKLTVLLQAGVIDYSLLEKISKKTNIDEFFTKIINFSTICLHNHQVDQSEKNVLLVEKSLSCAYTLIYLIQDQQTLSKIFTDDSISKLKDILLYFKNKHTYICEFLVSICFNEFKEKLIQKGLENLYQKLFDNLFMNYVEIVPEFTLSKSYEKFMHELLTCDVQVSSTEHFAAEIYQSILVMVFYKEKFNSNGADENKIKVMQKGDISNFYYSIAEKHILSTKESYKNETTSLFRKDDMYNALIKNSFIMFGNEFFVNTFYHLIQKHELLTKEIEIEKFVTFFGEFTESIIGNIPKILALIIGIINKNILYEYQIDNCDNVLIVVLVFNFFISPKIQNLYEISPSKFPNMRIINRIIRNICFNMTFDKADALSSFNEIITKCHLMIQEALSKILKEKVEELNIIDIPNCVYELHWKILSSALSLNNETIGLYQKK